MFITTGLIGDFILHEAIIQTSLIEMMLVKTLIIIYYSSEKLLLSMYQNFYFFPLHPLNSHIAHKNR